MATRTLQDQAIEQIAGILYDLHVTDWQEAQCINELGNWTFDVRWHDGEYINDRDFTRVTFDSLPYAMLQEAFNMAQRWAA